VYAFSIHGIGRTMPVTAANQLAGFDGFLE